LRAFEALKAVQRHLRAWDLKFKEGSPKVCLPSELPEVPAGEGLDKVKGWIEVSEEYWNSFECEEVTVPAAYDGKRVVYDPSAGDEAVKYLIASVYEHYLNHKLEGALPRLWEKRYVYVLSKVYGRLGALEALRASFEASDLFDSAAMRAASKGPDDGELDVKLFPSEKVRLFLDGGAELDERLEKVIINSPEFEKKLFATVILAEARKFIRNGSIA